MARRAIISSTTVLALAPPTQGVDTATLDLCTLWATFWIEEQLGWLLSSNAYVAKHSGGQAVSGLHPDYLDTLYLTDPDTGLATKPILSSPALTVSENKTALTVQYLNTGTTWTDGELALVNTSAGTIHRASSSDGVLAPKSWAAGFGNIVVGYSAGFDTSGTPTVPGDILYLAQELAWGMYREGSYQGLDALAESGVNLTFVRLLSPKGRAIIEARRCYRTPRSGRL